MLISNNIFILLILVTKASLKLKQKL